MVGVGVLTGAEWVRKRTPTNTARKCLALDSSTIKVHSLQVLSLGTDQRALVRKRVM